MYNQQICCSLRGHTRQCLRLRSHHHRLRCHHWLLLLHHWLLHHRLLHHWLLHHRLLHHRLLHHHRLGYHHWLINNHALVLATYHGSTCVLWHGACHIVPDVGVMLDLWDVNLLQGVNPRILIFQDCLIVRSTTHAWKEEANEDPAEEGQRHSYWKDQSSLLTHSVDQLGCIIIWWRITCIA